MSASFPGAVKTFAARNNGDVIQATHVGDLQDEINAIEDGYLNGKAPLNSSNASVNVLTLNGGQIVFPAGQSASAGVNTLDDYEEGTWTPAIGGTATYTTQTGSYTKVGRLVSIQGHLAINVIGSGNTGIITGLPFAPATLMVGSVGYYASLSGTYVFVSCFVNINATLQFTGNTAAAASMTNPAGVMGNGTDVYFSATYNV